MDVGLRGVATLERRATSKLYISDDQKMLSNGSKLLIRTPAGVCLYIYCDIYIYILIKTFIHDL